MFQHMSSEPLTDTRLHDFLAAVKPNGAYAILATQRMCLEWAALRILAAQPGVTVQWGRSHMTWPNYAWARLISIVSDSDFYSLRGTAWDAVLLVHGERYFPPSLDLFLESIRRTDDFKVFSVIW
jgi:hypothetical protein